MTKTSNYEYIPWQKKWGYVEKVEKIYETGRKIKHAQPDGTFKYIVGLGWSGFLLGALKDKLSVDDYNGIASNIIMADTYRTVPFSELRDYQNDDVLFLLRHRRGLMQVQTGYGKTQVIATLANYAHETLGKKLLIVCPSNKARDELVKRCKNVFGLSVSNCDKKLNGHLDCVITSGLMNSGKVKKSDSSEYQTFHQYLSEYEWVLVDEVEYTINDAGEYLYDSCISAERFYAFSGTADKVGGQAISFREGLSEVVVRNKNLIKYFGPSIIFRMPLNNSVTNISIKTASLDNLVLDDEQVDLAGNRYAEIMNQIWMDKDICRTVTRVIKKFPKCFIPMNNLNTILYDWINNYWLGVLRVLLVCGEGYIYYDLDGNKTKLTLDESCEYIKKGLVDVIPSTSSGYRALDFPGLENICLFAGKIAGVTLQCVGRVARGKHMNIITLRPYGNKKIPVYTKSAQERKEMIDNYYQYCEIEDIEMEESDL